MEQRPVNAPRWQPATGGEIYWIAAIFAAALTAVSGRYGYHRDELYFLAAGHRLDWGYPDQPPLVPLLARAMSAIDPNSVMLLRLPATLAATIVVVCGGLYARELGGGRVARAVAAGSVASAALLSGAGHTLSTADLDLAIWSMIVLVVLRLLRTSFEPRWWLAVGVLAGIGVQNKALIVVPLAVLALSLLAVGPREIFATKYFPAALVIAALISAPYLLWQARNGWPQWALSRAIAGGSSGSSNTRIQFVVLQFGLIGVFLVPLWIFGLWWLWQRYRAFALTYVVLFVAYLIMVGKAYYLGEMYPLLLAAGAVGAEPWLLARRIRLGTLAFAIALNAIFSAVVFLPTLPMSVLRNPSPILAINKEAGETVGWPHFVAQIADVRAHSAPDADILTANYGEAAAIEHYGAQYHLPTPHSVHNAYWWWGPPADTHEALIVGITADQVARFCADPQPLARIDNGLNIHNNEQGRALTLCRTPRHPWPEMWSAMRRLG
ncbi:glycosyltransferase family 39 protein [Nocardia sp. CDC153]|uniref:glycosyltransferase family 39 protein n=1 Tax=Nocardia sp. CDC153 TaxID=3112167 RepID=UPI002DBF1DE2|nr:glycosyltransferase family 39 protein [Nocardia sp. CDC153]MEC3952501.1 glycosyltransferase family 39 protein [Nocardia sp. CDC153]